MNRNPSHRPVSAAPGRQRTSAVLLLGTPSGRDRHDGPAQRNATGCNIRRDGTSIFGSRRGSRLIEPAGQVRCGAGGPDTFRQLALVSFAAGRRFCRGPVAGHSPSSRRGRDLRLRGKLAAVWRLSPRHWRVPERRPSRPGSLAAFAIAAGFHRRSQGAEGGRKTSPDLDAEIPGVVRRDRGGAVLPSRRWGSPADQPAETGWIPATRCPPYNTAAESLHVSTRPGNLQRVCLFGLREECSLAHHRLQAPDNSTGNPLYPRIGWPPDSPRCRSDRRWPYSVSIVNDGTVR